MGRGAYDTTGVPKSALRPPSFSRHETRHRSQQRLQSPGSPLPPDLSHVLMDIDPKCPENKEPTEEASDEVSTNDATRPEVTQQVDVDHAMQSTELLEDESKDPPSSRFTEEQRIVLEQWMVSNQSSPYPSTGDKEQLAHATGLSTKQIQMYCSNWRRRNLEKATTNHATNTTSFDYGFKRQSRLATLRVQASCEGKIPDAGAPANPDSETRGASIEALPSSPQSIRLSLSPYIEHATLPIAQGGNGDAVITGFSASKGNLLSWWLQAHFRIPTDDLPVPENVIPRSHSGSAGPGNWTAAVPESSTRYSAQSANSTTGSLHSNNGSRRGRKAYGLLLHKASNTTLSVNVANACEHCGKTFQRASTLKRHIQSVHETSRSWICKAVVKGQGSSSLCPTCLDDPSGCGHGMLSCWGKPEQDRTFYRKDLLKQHLRLVHGFGTQSTAEDGITLDLLELRTSSEEAGDLITAMFAV